MFAFLGMLWLDIRQSPSVRGEHFFYLLLDPFVLTLALPVAGVSAVGSFFLAYFWLDDTVIWKTAAFVYTAVLLEIIVVGMTDPMNALSGAFPVLLIAAVLSKLLFRRPAAHPRS